MWRAFFTAIGICLLIVGGECLVVDNAVLAVPQRRQVQTPQSPFERQPRMQGPVTREFRPPEWAPWTLLSAGAVVMLYTVTVARDSE